MPIGKKLLSIVLVVALTAASCTSYKVVKPPDIEKGVREGDTVRIVTSDRRDVRFKVTGITADAIIGERQRILHSDIAMLEVKRINDLKTAGLIGGILVVGAVLTGSLLLLICGPFGC